MSDLDSASTPRDLVNTPSKRICPASFWNLGKPAPGANRNSPSLRRWNATWHALEAELSGQAVPAPLEQGFDPVQAAIVASQIRTARSRLPSADRGEVDLDWPLVSIPIDSDQLRVFFQFAVRHPDRRLELYKLKTGQIREESEFATPYEEIAAVVNDPRFPAEMEAYELRATDGELIRLEMDREKAGNTLLALEQDYRQMFDACPDDVNPGIHCSTCKVADRCRTFPLIDPRGSAIVPLRKRLASAFRVMIPKSRLPEVEYCQRRAAWKTVFSIPPDPDHYGSEISPGLELGNRFHRLMAEAVLSDDPAAHFAGDLETESLYRQHLGLPCTSRLRIYKTEYPMGFTVRIRTARGPISVVVYGLADGAGREEDHTPAVIDHKTGASPRTYPYEAELYALGAFLLFKRAPNVATHIHHLSTSGQDPVCDRKVWAREQINDLALQLGSLADTVARWDYVDATSPPYRVGEWCATCPFEQRCLSYRE